MKPILLLCFFSFGSGLFAQKETVQKIDAAQIKSLVISGDEIFKLDLAAKQTRFITIKTFTGGEYYNNIKLHTEVKEKRLFLTSEYKEVLQSGFDKLSAHKVFAMRVEIELPQNFKVEITSNIASLNASGNYNFLFFQTKSGACVLSDFSGNALIQTYNGDIEVTANKIFVDAQSRHGKVVVPVGNAGNNKLELTSINGNITVRKAE